MEQGLLARRAEVPVWLRLDSREPALLWLRLTGHLLGHCDVAFPLNHGVYNLQLTWVRIIMDYCSGGRGPCGFRCGVSSGAANGLSRNGSVADPPGRFL